MFRNLRIVRHSCRRSFSQKTNATSASTPSATQLDINEQTGDAIKAAASDGKLAAREPLVKNFFLGVVDKELLGFPEVVNREDLAKLRYEVLPAQNFFNEDVDRLAIDATRSIPTTLLQHVAELGLYGINAPIEHNGKGYGWTESLFASEPETNCTDISLGLLSHRVIIDVLKELGTHDQQQRLLSKLASGELVGSEAIFEFNMPEYEFFNTTASYCTESNNWTLNGEKAYVVTGPLHDKNAALLYLVIAQTQRSNMTGDSARGTTILLVDGNANGVQLGEQHLTTGCRGLQMRHVKFDQVRVPASCVLGDPHNGNEIAEKILRSSRLRLSHIGLGMAKNLVNDLTHYCVNSTQCNVHLKDMEIFQTHLAKATCSTYAMESMIYMTSSLLDEFSRQDVALEAAITKYFCINQLFKMASQCMDMEPKSLHSGRTTELAFRNAAQLYTQGESMDSLRLFIALTGLQHAGIKLNDSIKKSRNPLFYPGHLLSKFLQLSSIENPRTKMRLGDNLHPTLAAAAQSIEHSVARLQMCVDLLLTRHGGGVVECHNEMLRLTEISTAIYSMFASVSRASRSYCIGLPLADYELLTAMAICTDGTERVKTLCMEVFTGGYVNNDNNLHRLTKQLTKSKGYFAAHPLTFNF